MAKRRATGPRASATPKALDSRAIDTAVASANRASAAHRRGPVGHGADEQDPHAGGAADAVHQADAVGRPRRAPEGVGMPVRVSDSLRSPRGRARARGRAGGSGCSSPWACAWAWK